VMLLAPLLILFTVPISSTIPVNIKLRTKRTCGATIRGFATTIRRKSDYENLELLNS
jgi:hypothetical protein